MDIKKPLLALLVGCTFFSTAYADINVSNRTNSYFTGKTSRSPCSSIIGGQGVISPNSAKKIPQSVFDMYCPKSCDAFIYASKSCGGKRAATARIDHAKGVVSVTIHDPRFIVSGGGKNIDIVER